MFFQYLYAILWYTIPNKFSYELKFVFYLQGSNYLILGVWALAANPFAATQIVRTPHI